MKKAIIIPNEQKTESEAYANELKSVLLSDGIECVISNKADSIRYEDANALIVLGGDGSILRSIDKAVEYDLPIFAINLGHLGYISQFEKGDEGKISKMINDGCKYSSRSLLSVKVKRNDEYIISNKYALNDAVVSRNNIGGVCETELFKDGKRVMRYRADGIIAATPTGSTAYSMSSGGPIIDPTINVICITPICAHSLKSRPIVFSGQSKLSLGCVSDDEKMILCIDGEVTMLLHHNDIVEIEISDKKVRFADTEKSEFCEILYEKMKD